MTYRPTGMTPREHDRIADDLATDLAVLRRLVDRLERRIVAHRLAAAGMRDDHQHLRQIEEAR